MTLKTYDATVTAIDDDEKRGRIRVACAALLGDEDADLPDWVEPNLQWGWFIVPDIGEIIEITVEEMEEQDESYGATSIDTPNIRWTGRRSWTDTETEDRNESRPIHEDMLTNYGKRRGFITPAGHVLYFDDTEGKEKVQLTYKKGNKYQFYTMDETGSTILQNISGTTIFMDAENKAFTIIDENQNVIQTGDDGIKLVDLFGNIFQLTNGVIQIISQGNVTVLGNACDIKTGTVNLLDGATSPVVRGDIFQNSVFDAHVHPGPFGPTGVPGPPTPFMASIVAALSANAKVGA